MKRDDRDIVAQQDYTPLSNAELVAHIEEYARLMHNTPLSDGEWLDDIIGPARVLLARAEAAAALAYERLEAALFAEQRATDAELECDDLRDANTVQAEALETTRQTLVALTARVAELTTERNTTGRRAFNAEAENQRLAAENRRLSARAAELEAQLAALGWWPVTERPAVTAQYQVALQSGNRRPTADHRAYYEDTGWVGPGVIFWRPIPPLPPAPNVQEPTP